MGRKAHFKLRTESGEEQGRPDLASTLTSTAFWRPARPSSELNVGCLRVLVLSAVQ